MKTIAITIIILLVTAGAVILWNKSNNSAASLDAFAQCLAGKNIIMYGADWCPHCQNEKKAFGKSFRFIPYVECPDDPKRCLAAGIAGFPTWIFPDNKKLEGEQGLQKLSEESGCPLPNLNN